MTVDYYEVLGIEKGTPPDEVRAAWQRATKAVHPDKGGTSALFRLVQEAGETLTDPAKRADYDAEQARPPEPEPALAPEPEWVPVDEPQPQWQPVDEAEHDPRDYSGVQYVGDQPGPEPRPITEGWPGWQRGLLYAGSFTLPYFAWLRAEEWLTKGGWERYFDLVFLVPVLAIAFAFALLSVAKWSPRKRWAWCVWALAWSNGIGLFVAVVVAVGSLARLVFGHGRWRKALFGATALHEAHRAEREIQQ